MANYFVCKKDGTKELVPEIVANAIFEAKSPKITWSSKTGKRMLDLALISELLPEEEYYRKHPEQRPPNKAPALPEVKYYNKVGSIKALMELKKGLEKFINENQGNCSKAIVLLEKMQAKINRVKECKEVNTTLNNLIKF